MPVLNTGAASRHPLASRESITDLPLQRWWWPRTVTIGSLRGCFIPGVPKAACWDQPCSAAVREHLPRLWNSHQWKSRSGGCCRLLLQENISAGYSRAWTGARQMCLHRGVDAGGSLSSVPPVLPERHHLWREQNTQGSKDQANNAVGQSRQNRPIAAWGAGLHSIPSTGKSQVPSSTRPKLTEGKRQQPGPSISEVPMSTSQPTAQLQQLPSEPGGADTSVTQSGS